MVNDALDEHIIGKGITDATEQLRAQVRSCKQMSVLLENRFDALRNIMVYDRSDRISLALDYVTRARFALQEASEHLNITIACLEGNQRSVEIARSGSIGEKLDTTSDDA